MYLITLYFDEETAREDFHVLKGKVVRIWEEALKVNPLKGFLGI